MAWSLLDSALSNDDPAIRDRQLWLLEACPLFEPGLLRALRAELDPLCGDVIASPLLSAVRSDVSTELLEVLAGLAVAARLQRTITPLPPIRARATPEGIELYRTTILLPWRDEQMARLRLLEAAVNRFDRDRYGGAMASVALARAWHWLSVSARRAPIPEPMKHNYEDRMRYYGMLDAELATTRLYARALDVVAATALSQQGVRRSHLANDWYALTATEFHGGFAKALSQLRLPLPPEFPALTAKQRVARRLPSHYAGLLFSNDDLEDVVLVRGLIENGLAIPHRRAFSTGSVRGDIATLLAHGRVALGRRTADAVQFDEAIHLLQGVTENGRLPLELQLLLVTAMAARSGPRGPSEAMNGSVRIARMDALQQLAESSIPNPVRAFALANWAVLRVVGSDEQESLIAEQVLGRAFRGAEGTELAPCLRGLGMLFGLKFLAEPRDCTIAEKP